MQATPTTYSYPRTVDCHPGMATLTDGSEAWPSQDRVGSDFDQEFQSWAA